MLVVLIVILTLNVTRSALLSVANKENHFRSFRQQRANSCFLPQHPEHGFLTSGIPLASPAQSYDALQVNVTCDPGYGVVGSSNVFCYKGFWSQTVPECVRLCKLEKDPSVHYRCIDPSSEEGHRECNRYEFSGTIVRPVCNTPNYYAHDIQPNMRCDKGRWNYIAKCTPECGRVTPSGAQLVAGGRTTKRGELPWHVGIYKKTFIPYMQICGGSIVSNSVVISAAHCFYVTKLLPASEFAVAVGKLYRPYDDQIDDEGGAQKSDVKEIKIPSRYQGRQANFQEDIALLYLTTAIVYQTYVRPICLDFDYAFDRRHLLPGNIGKVAGWGLMDVNGPAALTLKVVELPYIDIAQCLAKSPNTFAEYITGDKICAGYQNNGTAVCRGDSGGGLVFPAMSDRGFERYYLRGVVSTAPDDTNLCNTQTFTAFTQVLKHEHFITANLYIYSDEASVECLEEEWSCTDGACIPLSKRCDGVTDCPDNSDETNSRCRYTKYELTSPDSGRVTSKSNQKCLQYKQQAVGLSCMEAPYLAVLRFGKRRNISKFKSITGAIISDRYILTTAYIVREPDVTYAVLGVRNSKVYEEDWRLHDIAEITVHPEYDYTEVHNLALLKTDTPIQFSDRVQPACLPPPGFLDAMQDATTTTFVRKDEILDGVARTFTVQQYTYQVCSSKYTGTNSSIHVCLGHRDDLKESCYLNGGDSAVVRSIDSPCVSTVVAFLSHDLDCTHPNLCTKVSYYVPWVESVVWPDGK